MIGQTLSHYRVVEQLGAGGMGVVYRARDARLDRDVALKVLPPGTLTDETARKRFRKEALTLSRLNHPNIETVHDFDTQDGIDFLVIEYLQGVTLEKRLMQSTCPEKEISRLGVQLAEGLAAAHEKGVVHRDLKPSNILIGEDSRLKILDFGIAAVLHPATETTVTESSVEAGSGAGTLPYMSPEQLRSERVDARSDLWAAGAVLYEMATGRRAFCEITSARLIDAILHGAPQHPQAINSKISAELERIILKCLEKDPEDRYQSARELAVDLRRLGTPSTAAVAPRRIGLTQRVPLMAGAGFVALLAILAGLNVGGLRDRLRWTGAHPGRIESLAVLPLQNLSGDPAQDYFADGMTEELTTNLAEIGSLRVISRGSTGDYKGTKKPLAQIAKELNVDALVQGSVQRSKDSLRVTARLLEGPTGQHLWAHSYERPMSDVLVLQDEIARAIAKEVGAKLNPEFPVRPSNNRQVNPAAYELYLRGSSYFDDFDLNKSIDYLNQSIKLDPNYPATYSKMAEAYYFLGFFNLLPPNVALTRMKEAAQNALAKDETLAEAHGALALVKLHYDWDFSGSEKEFKRALELNPNNADIRHDFSHFLMAMGRFDEATAESARAVDLDPVDIGLTACLCWHRYSAHQYGESVVQAQKAIRLAPDLFWSHIILGWDYEQMRKFDEAIGEFQNALKLSGFTAFSLAPLAHAYAIAGKKQLAKETLAKLEEIGKHGYISAFDFAIIYTGMGEREKAFEWLEKAFQERSLFLIYSRWEPRLDPLRSDPRFSSLLHRMGLPQT